MDKKVQIHVNIQHYNSQTKQKIKNREPYVDVPIDVSKFEEFMTWYNKGGNLNDSNLDKYVDVINSLKSAFEKEFSDINCLSEYTTNSCYTQVGPFSFYNYWKENEYVESLRKKRPQSEYDPKKQDINRIAASELKEKYSNKIKFKIMPVVTIGIYENTELRKQLKNDVEIFDTEHKLYNKLFPSHIKSILVGVAGVLASLIVGYAAHILANPDEYNQNGGSEKRFSGGNLTIQELIASIDKTGLTEDQKNALDNALDKITTVEELKNFIDTNLQKLTPKENEKIQEELENKLTPKKKKIIKNDFPGFDLKDDETVFGFFGDNQGGKPLTKRHRKKRQNKKRKSRKSKK